MILSETELQIGDDRDGIMVLPTTLEPGGTPLAEVLPFGDDGDRARGQPEPASTASASTASRASCTRSPAPRSRRPPWDEDAEATGEGEAERPRLGRRVEVPELCPRFSARVFTDVADRPLAAVAEGAADRRRAAADQQRRRHHQLRDADDRPAAARLRPRQGRRAAQLIVRTAREGETHDDARRRRARASTPSGARLRRATARPGSPGSWAAQAPRSPRRPRASLLEVATWNGVNILRTSTQARAADRGLEPLREAAPPGAGAAGAAGRREADGRALRRAAGPRDDRRGRRDPRRRTGWPARPRASSACSGCRSSRRVARTTSSGSASTVAERDGDDSRPRSRSIRHYDVTREVDLIEEVGRIHGYVDHLPATLPARRRAAGG